jgi:hypothetical protein
MMGHHIIASYSHCLLRVETPFYYTPGHLQYNRKPNGNLTQRRERIRARECGHDAVMPVLVALM